MKNDLERKTFIQIYEILMREKGFSLKSVDLETTEKFYDFEIDYYRLTFQNPNRKTHSFVTTNDVVFPYVLPYLQKHVNDLTQTSKKK